MRNKKSIWLNFCVLSLVVLLVLGCLGQGEGVRGNSYRCSSAPAIEANITEEIEDCLARLGGTCEGVGIGVGGEYIEWSCYVYFDRDGDSHSHEIEPSDTVGMYSYDELVGSYRSCLSIDGVPVVSGGINDDNDFSLDAVGCKPSGYSGGLFVDDYGDDEDECEEC